MARQIVKERPANLAIGQSVLLPKLVSRRQEDSPTNLTNLLESIRAIRGQHPLQRVASFRLSADGQQNFNRLRISLFRLSPEQRRIGVEHSRTGLSARQLRDRPGTPQTHSSSGPPATYAAAQTAVTTCHNRCEFAGRGATCCDRVWGVRPDSRNDPLPFAPRGCVSTCGLACVPHSGQRSGVARRS